MKCCSLYGGTSTQHQRGNLEVSIKCKIVYHTIEIFHVAATYLIVVFYLQGGCHILVATVGRLMDFTQRSYVKYDNIQYVVLDEADRMLEMGFKEEIDKLMHHPTMPPPENRNVLMFSATMPSAIQQLAGKYLERYLFLTVGIVGGACEDVEQTFYEIDKKAKRNKLMEILKKDDPSGTIIFVETKKNADYLASFLCESDLDTTSIHGDRTQQQREEALNEFKRGIRKILIATAVASRGLGMYTIAVIVDINQLNVLMSLINCLRNNCIFRYKNGHPRYQL